MAINRAAVVDGNFQRFVAERPARPTQTRLDLPVRPGTSLTARQAILLFQAQVESRTWIPPVRVLDYATVSQPERGVVQIMAILALLAAVLVSLVLALAHDGKRSDRARTGVWAEATQLIVIFVSGVVGVIATILLLG